MNHLLAYGGEVAEVAEVACHFNAPLSFGRKFAETSPRSVSMFYVSRQLETDANPFAIEKKPRAVFHSIPPPKKKNRGNS